MVIVLVMITIMVMSVVMNIDNGDDISRSY